MDSPKILVVDDDEDILFLLDRFLTSEGDSVLLAEDGEKGLDLAKTEKPDLEINSLDDLVAAATLRTLPCPITDYFIAATIHDPGIEPPLGLK